MSETRKPSDDTTPMGKLKRLCRQNEALRDELFKLSDDKTSAVWRAEVKKRFGIWLSADSQVTRWRDWVCDQMDAERLNDRVESFEERYRRDNPAASEEQVRTEGIRYFMEQAIARSDGDLFLNVMDRDQKERQGRTNAELKRAKLELDREKFTYLQKKELEKALDALHAEIKDNPQALEAFRRFKDSISRASSEASAK